MQDKKRQQNLSSNRCRKTVITIQTALTFTHFLTNILKARQYQYRKNLTLSSYLKRQKKYKR